jgi:hypothetical protein
MDYYKKYLKYKTKYIDLRNINGGYKINCPTERNKNYFIPTRDWLIPTAELITIDNKSRGLIIVSNLLKKKEIIVKVTKGRNDKLLEYPELLNDMPNMATTYCSFSCADDFDKNKIIANKEFCKNKESRSIVTLELIKYYREGSLNNIKQISYETYKNIVKQLLFAQLNIFYKEGFTHNDVHLGNILVYTHKDDTELKYTNINKTIITQKEYKLVDYDKIQSFKVKDMFNTLNDMNIEPSKKIKSNNYNTYYIHSLLSNILQTIDIPLKLLKIETQEKLVKLINKFKEKNEKAYLNENMRITKIYINNRTLKEYAKFKDDITLMNLNIVSKLEKIFDDLTE